MPNQRNVKELNRLWKSIILAIILGDDAAFQYTVHTVLINPFIGCILHILVQKCIEYLSFGCTTDTLDRMLKFLTALAQNYHTRDISNNEEYFHLSNIMVCLLLGPADVKEQLTHIKAERQQHKLKEQMAAKLNKEKLDKKIRSAPHQLTDELLNIKMEADPFVTKIDVDCDFSLTQVLQEAAGSMNIKSELFDDSITKFSEDLKSEPNFYEMDFQATTPLDLVTDPGCKSDDDFHIKNESIDETSLHANVTDEEEQDCQANELFSPFETQMCEEGYVDELCSVMACLSSKWGYFEHEVIFLLSKRLEIFFHSTTSWNDQGECTRRRQDKDE